MEDVSFQSPVLNKPAKKPRRLIFWIVLIIIIGVLALMGFRFIGGKDQKSEEKITPTPTEFIIPTEAPTPTEEVTPTEEPETTPTSKPTSNPIDKTTGLNRSKLSITVQNGSGVAGVAGTAANFLKNLGYNVISTGNADNFDYSNVTIQVKTGKSEFLSLLKKDLGTQYTLGNSSSDLSASSSADALVIIGK
ncbi:MAG: LytR C-terminal domain-containing protein [Candidatus Levybacteria bacterium]|nr:LytR C-terminal domain-containing protein [Candidatus Levybacteria bacterium]